MNSSSNFDHYYGRIVQIGQPKNHVHLNREDGASFQVHRKTLYGGALLPKLQVGQLVRMSFEQGELVAAYRIGWPHVITGDWERFLRSLRAASRHTPKQAHQWIERLDEEERQKITEREIQDMLKSAHQPLREWGGRLSSNINLSPNRSERSQSGS